MAVCMDCGACYSGRRAQAGRNNYCSQCGAKSAKRDWARRRALKSKTKTLSVEFKPDSRLSKNGMRRAHWRETQPLVKQAREDAYVLALVEEQVQGWETPERCRVSVRQYYCGKPYDWDGLATLCGPFMDGLVDAGALPVDDDPSHIVEYTMSAERVNTRDESRIVVTIELVSG